MSLEEALVELSDPSKRLSTTQLANLSDLEREDVTELAETWPLIDASRRARIVAELTELAADNVDLNFDAVFKTALQDEEAVVREAAIRGLAEYDRPDLIPALADLLRNESDSDVKREAASALGRFALEAELGHFREEDREAIRDVLIESAEDVDEDELVRARSIEALGAISGEDTENLIESIYHEDSMWLKVGAVDAMGRSCNETWLPIVMRETENPAPEMRHAAAFAAGEIGDEAAIPRLKDMAVQDPDKEVQRTAVHAIGEIGGPHARVALKTVLYEGDDDLQQAIEEAMAEVDFNENPLSPNF
jgi:HEAT repeat protein